MASTSVPQKKPSFLGRVSQSNQPQPVVHNLNSTTGQPPIALKDAVRSVSAPFKGDFVAGPAYGSMFSGVSQHDHKPWTQQEYVGPREGIREGALASSGTIGTNDAEC